MLNARRSFCFRRPKCPCCESKDVRIVRSAGNVLRIAADTLLSLFAFPALSYEWRCSECGCEFAVDRVEDR